MVRLGPIFDLLGVAAPALSSLPAGQNHEAPAGTRTGGVARSRKGIGDVRAAVNSDGGGGGGGCVCACACVCVDMCVL